MKVKNLFVELIIVIDFKLYIFDLLLKKKIF